MFAVVLVALLAIGEGLKQEDEGQGGGNVEVRKVPAHPKPSPIATSGEPPSPSCRDVFFVLATPSVAGLPCPTQL
jgi:hypothetical protein